LSSYPPCGQPAKAIPEQFLPGLSHFRQRLESLGERLSGLHADPLKMKEGEESFSSANPEIAGVGN
jgi:hypothetical protein